MSVHFRARRAAGSGEVARRHSGRDKRGARGESPLPVGVRCQAARPRYPTAGARLDPRRRLPRFVVLALVPVGTWAKFIAAPRTAFVAAFVGQSPAGPPQRERGST